MAGANNRALKAHGFKAREIQKIRKGYGIISSAKEAALAAKQVGVRIPPKLQAHLDGTKAPAASAPGTKSAAAKLVEQGLGSAVKGIEKKIRAQQGTEISKGEAAAKLARKLTDRDVQIITIGRREFESFVRTGKHDRNALSPKEWSRYEKLSAVLDKAA
jgi:hypothetical protein